MRMVFRSLGLCAFGLASLFAASPASAQIWKRVCLDGETCAVQGTRTLRFGTAEKYYYGVTTNTVDCSARTFGDPTPGVKKVCEAYYTTKEQSVLDSIDKKDDRIRKLERQVRSLQAELTDTNAELNGLYKELRRERRRDQRREERPGEWRGQFGPFQWESR